MSKVDFRNKVLPKFNVNVISKFGKCPCRKHLMGWLCPYLAWQWGQKNYRHLTNLLHGHLKFNLTA